MKGLGLGSIMMLVVLVYGLADQELAVFMNSHALVIVVMGTVAVLFLATPYGQIRSVFTAMSGGKKFEPSLRKLNADILSLARKKQAVIEDPHPMISHAQELWKQGVDEQMFRLSMMQYAQQLENQTYEAVSTMRNIAKYPPALGMTGTVIGLVALFSQLNPESKSSIGPALALAMTATFYGLVLSNGLLMPLSDRLHLTHIKREKTNEYIMQLLLQIDADQPLMVNDDEEENAA